MKRLIIACGLVSILSMIGCGPKYVVINPLEEPLDRFDSIEIGELTDALPAGVPPEERPTSEVAEKLRGFLRDEVADEHLFSSVSLVGSSGSRPVGDLLLTGKFVAYRGGSRAARYIVGFGAGKGETVVQLSLRDGRSGDEVFSGSFKGKVSGGLFGGSNDEPLKIISRQFASFLRHEWKNGSYPRPVNPQADESDDDGTHRSRDRRGR